MNETFYSPTPCRDESLEEARREATAAHFRSLLTDSEVDEDKRGVIRIPDGLKWKK